MNKQDIIDKLDAFPYDRNDFWVITGGAMVLYGFREQTHDIDMGCNTKMADQLERDGFLYRFTEDGLRWFIYGEDIEIFEGWLCDKVDVAENIPVISVKGLIEMKQRLGREKDLRDIALINEYIKGSKRI